MTRVMYDSVTVSEIPADAHAVAGYIDGNFRNFQDLGRFHANRLSIAVTSRDDAACLDVEPGDAPPPNAAGWVKRQLAKGAHRPVIYASRDTVPTVLADLAAAGVHRSQIRIWSAHYGAGAHICSGRSCGASFTADGTQWTDRALGRNLDESLLSDEFFPAAPKHRPKKPHPKVTAATFTAAIATAITAVCHKLGVHIDAGEAAAIATAAAGLGGYFFPKGSPR